MPEVEEIWVDIPGYPGYKASSLGRIRNARQIIKPYLCSRGYYQVGLLIPKLSSQRVNRLVCMAFHGLPPFPKAMALHKNHVKTNNTPGNLYWGTHQDNMGDLKNAGYHKGARGEKCWAAKLTWDKVREIRHRANAGESGAALAREFGIAQAHCSGIINKRFWKE